MKPSIFVAMTLAMLLSPVKGIAPSYVFPTPYTPTATCGLPCDVPQPGPVAPVARPSGAVAQPKECPAFGGFEIEGCGF